MLEAGGRATWVHGVPVEDGILGEMRPGRGRLSSAPGRPVCSGPPVHDGLVQHGYSLCECVKPSSSRGFLPSGPAGTTFLQASTLAPAPPQRGRRIGQ